MFNLTLTHLYSKSISQHRGLQRNRWFPNVDGTSLCFNRESLKEVQEMDETEDEERKNVEDKQKEAVAGLAIHILHAKMLGAISEIPSCRFPMSLECRPVFSLSSLSLFPPPSLSLLSLARSLPSSISLSLHNIDLSSVSSSSLSCFCRSSSRANILGATWNWHGALKISTADIRPCNLNRNQIIRAAFNLIVALFFVKDSCK